MSKVLIAVTAEFADDIESLINGFVYQKNVREDCSVVYSFNHETWHHPDDDFSTVLMSILHNPLMNDNHAFIRVGEELDDIEVCGDLEKLNIVFKHIVEF
jgi:hypothetical protein